MRPCRAVTLNNADRGTTWINAVAIGWDAHGPPDFAALGELAATEALYDHELDFTLEIARNRAHAAVVSCDADGPAFACVQTEGQFRFRLAFNRMNYRLLRPGDDWPAVVGATVGDRSNPTSLSFVIWSVRPASDREPRS